MGVLYHLRHPLLALDLIHEHVAGDLMLFQTMQRGSNEIDPVQADYDFFETAHLDSPGYPKMVFFEHRYAHDPTNWWAPNAACAEAMLRASGFETVGHPEQEVYLCRRVELGPSYDGPRAVHAASPPPPGGSSWGRGPGGGGSGSLPLSEGGGQSGGSETPEGAQKAAGSRRPSEGGAVLDPIPEGAHSGEAP